MRQRILNNLEDQEPEMFSLLEGLVLQESYTPDKDGVDAVGHLIEETLASHMMTVERNRQTDHGDHLVFRSSACTSTNSPPILLLGHMDTVFPPEMGFNWYREDGENVYGPGVIDMKGGLVVAIFALKALARVGLLETIPITLICNSDEETGSLTSEQLLREEARKSLLALVFECGGNAGELVTGRKGKMGHVIDVTGQAGHAAFAGKNKASSLLELAHKTIAIEALNNDPDHELVVNVGLVKGGIGPNTVAEKSSALIDCRFVTREAGEYYQEQIKSIVNTCTVPGTRATSHVTSSRTVMEARPENKELLDLFIDQARSLHLPLREEFRSGVSDANTVADCGIPVLDGLGPIGQHDHSNKEFMVKKSLLDRTRLTALGLLAIHQQHTTG